MMHPTGRQCVAAGGDGPPERHSTTSGATGTQVRLEPSAPSGRRILVVDDNRDAADSLGLLLGLDGHDVRVAYAGREALEIAASFRPETVILDLGLPDVSGYDVARLLRQDPKRRGVALVALTGWSQDEHKQRAREAGFDHHLTKPVDLDLLAAALTSGATL